MGSPIRVLVVEDSADDAELEILCLQQAGFAITYTRVDTAEAFVAALAEPYDVVLADYRMPSFSGLQALRLLQQQGLQIPLILISGTVGEEQAIECIKLGATDYLLKDRLGRLPSAVQHALDESAMRKAQEGMTSALQHAERENQLLRRAVEQSPVAIFITDRSGKITYVNPHCVESTGYSYAELIGGNPGLLKSGLTAQSVYENLWKAIAAGRRWQGELKNRKKNGELVWVSVQISPITDADGNVTHYVAVEEDITERKATELALRELNEELEQHVEERTAELRRVNTALQHAAQAKDEFLASMSHELRTPLAGILGLTEGLQDGIYGGLTERQAHALKAVRSSGEHLLGLINDVLDVAKAEAGLLQPHFDLFSVDDVCQASINLIRGMAQKKHLRVCYSINPTSIPLVADARRVKQILVNLLSNAIKFTPEEGSIGLAVVAQPELHSVRFSVLDNGIGIAHEDLPRLFRPFAQLHNGLDSEHTGTGLGLALVRNMAEVHGGSVEVESTVGQGSRFTVVLPWRQSEALADLSLPPALPQAEEVQAAGKVNGEERPLILLADDNATMLEVYQTYLEVSGCRVVSAFRGSEAVRLAETIHPSLILMDIQMPGMDGLSAIRRLRSSKLPGVASIPIIALTALAMPGDRERCLAAGADDYLSKPIPLSTLVSSVNKLLAHSR
jgi:PAS domain S-box-containing protein